MRERHRTGGNYLTEDLIRDRRGRDVKRRAHRLNVRVDEDLYGALRAEAEAARLTLAAVLRLSLVAGVERVAGRRSRPRESGHGGRRRRLAGVRAQVHVGRDRVGATSRGLRCSATGVAPYYDRGEGAGRGLASPGDYFRGDACGRERADTMAVARKLAQLGFPTHPCVRFAGESRGSPPIRGTWFAKWDGLTKDRPLPTVTTPVNPAPNEPPPCRPIRRIAGVLFRPRLRGGEAPAKGLKILRIPWVAATSARGACGSPPAALPSRIPAPSHVPLQHPPPNLAATAAVRPGRASPACASPMPAALLPAGLSANSSSVRSP